VAVKTEDQQATLALHRVRQQFVRFLVIQVTSCADCCMGSAVVLPQGRRASIEAAKDAMASLIDRLAAMR
jgi:transposase